MFHTIKKRAQSAAEMAVIVTFMVLFMSVFLIVIADRFVEQQKKRYDVMLDDISDVIAAEAQIATAVEDGYARKFSIPTKLKGREYNLTLINYFEVDSFDKLTNFSTLVMFFSDKPAAQKITRLPGNVVGKVVKGENEFVKADGYVFTNCGDEYSQFDQEICTAIDEDLRDYNCYDYCQHIEDEFFDCNVCCILFDKCCEECLEE